MFCHLFNFGHLLFNSIKFYRRLMLLVAFLSSKIQPMHGSFNAIVEIILFASLAVDCTNICQSSTRKQQKKGINERRAGFILIYFFVLMKNIPSLQWPRENAKRHFFCDDAGNAGCPMPGQQQQENFYGEFRLNCMFCEC